MSNDASARGPDPSPSDFAAFQRARRRFLEQVSDRSPPLYPPAWAEPDHDDHPGPGGRSARTDPPV